MRVKAKVLVRVDLQDANTVRTLEETARAVTQAANAKLPIMLEPFMSRRVDGRVVNDLSTEAVINSVAIASRALKMRDRTVPIGQFITSAISS